MDQAHGSPASSAGNAVAGYWNMGWVHFYNFSPFLFLLALLMERRARETTSMSSTERKTIWTSCPRKASSSAVKDAPGCQRFRVSRYPSVCVTRAAELVGVFHKQKIKE
jgi:hypothetical protein